MNPNGPYIHQMGNPNCNPDQGSDCRSSLIPDSFKYNSVHMHDQKKAWKWYFFYVKARNVRDALRVSKTVFLEERGTFDICLSCEKGYHFVPIFSSWFIRENWSVPPPTRGPEPVEKVNKWPVLGAAIAEKVLERCYLANTQRIASASQHLFSADRGDHTLWMLLCTIKMLDNIVLSYWHLAGGFVRAAPNCA